MRNVVHDVNHVIQGFVPEDLIALFEAKLASSGLDMADAKKLNLFMLDRQQVTELNLWNGFARPIAMGFTYVDPWGLYRGYARYRALNLPAKISKNFPKYTQLKGTPPHAYFPTNISNWPKILADPSKSIIITEGELKAAKACKEGFLTISLGGVWSFGSKQRKIDFLPELERTVWSGRTVFICYDSDAATKPEVAKAEQALANHLIKRGAIAMRVKLTELGGVKTGLDDYLIACGVEKFQHLLGDAEQMEFDWRLLYQMGPTGPAHNISNVMIALQCAPQLNEAFGYDQMRLAPSVIGPFLNTLSPRRWLTDADVLGVQIWLQAEGGLPLIAKQTIADAIDYRAQECMFHPVRDHLRTLKWDRTPRLGIWLSETVGAPVNAYHAAVGRMFIISMIARVMKPGAKVDYMLILEDTQGLMKSTLFRILAGDEWFSDDLPDINKDAVRLSQHMRGVWLIEISELGTMSKADIAEWKRFQTRQFEVYTPKYGRGEVHEPRQCVFAGTTNDNIYLRDETGNRRFWPVVVVRHNLPWLIANRDQLFAEALVRYEAGEHWWPDEAFEHEFIKPEQDARFSGGEWDDDILGYLRLRQTDKALPIEFTANDVATGLSIELTRRNSETFRRIAAALNRLGCTKRRLNGKWLYSYRK